MLQVNDNGATLKWGGMDLKDVTSCEYSYSDLTNQTQSIPVVMIKRPTDYKLKVDSLLPATLYNIHLTCELNGQPYQSEVNISTGEKYLSL